MTEHPYANILRAIADGEQICLEAADGVTLNNVTAEYVLQLIVQGNGACLSIEPKMLNINGMEFPAPTGGPYKLYVTGCGEHDTLHATYGHDNLEAFKAHFDALVKASTV